MTNTLARLYTNSTSTTNKSDMDIIKDFAKKIADTVADLTAEGREKFENELVRVALG